ncbi:SRPBCC family protein [Myceligenerans salitolerans]|uniref:SRPBCC family protein n=1 Tax=Myceligenerans salitolerans TaxID=1230528 RepID=A0ABS3I8W8_9MICO|nr:SRPBCC family protein [Myceligenerans salitolerans]MBO0609454.1 SRPBCC family protein [Myceligenerans salitolerans]
MHSKELGTIQRELLIEAAPEVVFDVVSKPEHLKEWWPDDARYEPTPGSAGEIIFINPEGEGDSASFTVVEAIPPRVFSFRWTHPAGETAAEGNSLLVTFELMPREGGTSLRMTETGFREMGWEAAVLEEQYREHMKGWDYFLPRLAPYIATLEKRL